MARMRIAALMVAALLLAESAQAQDIGISPAVQTEIHAGIVVSRTNSAVAGFGLNVPAGLYMRIAADLAASVEVGAVRGSMVRAEVVGRFLTDPFRETRWAPYIGGGIGGVWRAGDHGRPALLAVVGTDFGHLGGWTPSLEIGVGAGAQLRFALRRTRARGR